MLVIASVAVAVLVGGASAAPGDLDPSFGTNGVASTSIGTSTRVVELARQPDGKLVVAGGAWTGSTGDVALVRYTAAGQPDLSFGTGGIVTTDLGGSDAATALALQPDGKLVVAARRFASGSDRVHLVRYLPNGAVDTTFAVNGVAATPIDGNSGGSSGLALQPDGRILVASTRGSAGVDLVRYLPSGILDSSFAGDGTVATPLGGLSGLGAGSYSIAVQPDGSIVVKAVSGIGAELVRYAPGGTPDGSFGTGGHVRLFLPFSPTRLALRPDGKIVLAGLWSCGSACDFGLVRLTSSGALDASFDGDGIVTTDLGASEAAYALAPQPDGKLIVAGGRRVSFPGDADFVVARYTPDGAPDPSFGVGGIARTDLGADEVAVALALYPDGRIAVAGDGGGHSPFASTRFVVVRYLGDLADITPPVLTVPTAVEANATGPAGAIVAYAVSAVDDVDGPVAVSCSPPSGSLFPIGTTVVECEATDDAANTALATFSVHVKGAEEQLADLVVALDGLAHGLATSLAAKLEGALAALVAEPPRAKPACNKLVAFINEVEAQSAKALSVAESGQLIAAANRIRAVLSC